MAITFITFNFGCLWHTESSTINFVSDINVTFNVTNLTLTIYTSMRR